MVHGIAAWDQEECDTYSRSTDDLYGKEVESFSVHGRQLSQEERQQIADRRGVCVYCAIRTCTAKGPFRRNPVTNEHVWQGFCIRHYPDKVPNDICAKWQAENLKKLPSRILPSSSSSVSSAVGARKTSDSSVSSNKNGSRTLTSVLSSPPKTGSGSQTAQTMMYSQSSGSQIVPTMMYAQQVPPDTTTGCVTSAKAVVLSTLPSAPPLQEVPEQALLGNGHSKSPQPSSVGPPAQIYAESLRSSFGSASLTTTAVDSTATPPTPTPPKVLEGMVQQFVKQFDEASYQADLRKLGAESGNYKSVEEFATDFYIQFRERPEDPRLIEINDTRKRLLYLLYEMVDQWNEYESNPVDHAQFEAAIAKKFKARRLERILMYCLPMDRAQALHKMTLPSATTTYGLHWYSKSHLVDTTEYARLFPEEQAEWKDFLANYQGRATMNKRLFQVLYSPKLEFQKNNTLAQWSRPCKAGGSGAPPNEFEEIVQQFVQQFDEASYQTELEKLEAEAGKYNSLEEFARDIYTKFRECPEDPHLNEINDTRKRLLKIVYELVDEWDEHQSNPPAHTQFAMSIAATLEEQYLKPILTYCLPMDRAQSLFRMTLPSATTTYGLHWYSKSHLLENTEYARQFPEEQAEWKEFLANYQGRATMNRRLFQLLYSPHLKLQQNDLFAQWSRPSKVTNSVS